MPGFPVDNEITTNSFTISDVHLFSPRTVQTIRAAFLRNVFFYGEAQNHTPASSLGFQYQPTLASALGSPYLIVSGYSSVGNPITGSQNTYQNDYQGYYSLATSRGRHNLKFGADLNRQQINVLLGIATNGFFVFAPFPVNDSFASFLVGQSVQFFQGGGDFSRGLRKWIGAGYAQDEWRITPKLTLSYGLRYEINTPYTEIRNRMNAWAPGQQSTVMPNAPKGCCSPAIKASPPESRPSAIAKSCRALAWLGIPPGAAEPPSAPLTASSTMATRMASAARYKLLFPHSPGPRPTNYRARALTLPIPTMASSRRSFPEPMSGLRRLSPSNPLCCRPTRKTGTSPSSAALARICSIFATWETREHICRASLKQIRLFIRLALLRRIRNSAAPMPVVLPMVPAPSAPSA